MTEMAHFFPKPMQMIRRLPMSRDQLMLLMMAVNELFLGLDTYLAHSTSGTIVPREWIPIYFGFLSGGLLLLAGLIAIRNRPAATVIATTTLVASIIVGVLGAYFHFARGITPAAPVGQRISLNLLIWAPPVMGPLAFAMVGVLGISAAWIEKPANSGILRLWGKHTLHLPYSKTRAYFFIVGMGILAALISSVFDHARTGFHDPGIWIATGVGIFGLVVSVTMGAINHPSRADWITYLAAMILLVVIGPLGTLFHVQADLVAGNTFVLERFLRGAPFLAPLLYANMGVLGLIALLDPSEKG